MISSVATKSIYSPLFDTASNTTSGTTNDPGVVGPASPTTGSPSTITNNSLNKDDFMKLLVAQLKNQDPSNPMDGKDMAAQLAQFSSVEQLMAMNKSITAQADSQTKIVDAITALQTGQTTQSDNLAALVEGQMAVSTVGKTGVTTGNALYVDRDGSGSVTIDTGSISGTGHIIVKDASGAVVGESDVTNVKAGMQSIDLRDMNLTPPLKGGTYSYSFKVERDGATLIDAKTYTTGRITGLRYENGTPVLVIGDALSVPFSQLVQIRS